MPRFAISSMVGCMICEIAFDVTSFVIIGAGEYAPIPPVFGPVSPSNTRL